MIGQDEARPYLRLRDMIIFPFLRLIEEAVGRPAVREPVPAQPGDMVETCRCDLQAAVGFAPDTAIALGIRGHLSMGRPQGSELGLTVVSGLHEV